MLKLQKNCSSFPRNQQSRRIYQIYIVFFSWMLGYHTQSEGGNDGRHYMSIRSTNVDQDVPFLDQKQVFL